MQLYSPLSTTPKRRSVRAPALGSIDGLRIGILENGKLNAEEMLNEVAALFVQQHGCTVRTLNWAMNNTKNNANRLPEPSKIARPENRERDFGPAFGGTKFSCTMNQTSASPEKQVAEVM